MSPWASPLPGIFSVSVTVFFLCGTPTIKPCKNQGQFHTALIPGESHPGDILGHGASLQRQSKSQVAIVSIRKKKSLNTLKCFNCFCLTVERSRDRREAGSLSGRSVRIPNAKRRRHPIRDTPGDGVESATRRDSIPPAPAQPSLPKSS